MAMGKRKRDRQRDHVGADDRLADGGVKCESPSHLERSRETPQKTRDCSSARVRVHASGVHLQLWMRLLFGVGTPRALQGRFAAFLRKCSIPCGASRTM